jgi:lauroyl/myristoyl acyltransferase
VRGSYDGELDALIDTHRTRRGSTVIHRGQPDTAWRIASSLRRGAAVGFLADLAGRVQCEPARLFGCRARLPVGPLRIARARRCPLLFGSLQRQPDGVAGPRFELTVHRLDPADSPKADEPRAGQRESKGETSCSPLRQLARAMAVALEDAVRSSPEDWLWMAETLPILQPNPSAPKMGPSAVGGTETTIG